MVAVLYFTANFSAQNTKNDTLPKEQKIEEVVMIGYGTQKIGRASCRERV